MSQVQVGFVGLGVMGGPMAGHLLRSGHSLVVYNRTVAKTEPLAQLGAKVADLPDLAKNCKVIFLCVNRTEDVRQCLDQMKDAAPGTLFVDHSTILPEGAVEIHSELAARGHRFVDAPVTGGSVGAQKGLLTIFLGGEVDDVAEAKSIMAPYTKRAERVGGSGAGQQAKMVNQIAVAGTLLALCESLSFAQKAGLDLSQIRDLVGSGAAGSWAFDNYGPKLLDRDWSPGFSITNQRKDFGYCKEAARAVDAAIPGTDLVDSLLARLDEQGHGDWATVALFEAMLELGGR